MVLLCFQDVWASFIISAAAARWRVNGLRLFRRLPFGLLHYSRCNSQFRRLLVCSNRVQNSELFQPSFPFDVSAVRDACTILIYRVQVPPTEADQVSILKMHSCWSFLNQSGVLVDSTDAFKQDCDLSEIFLLELFLRSFFSKDQCRVFFCSLPVGKDHQDRKI